MPALLLVYLNEFTLEQICQNLPSSKFAILQYVCHLAPVKSLFISVKIIINLYLINLFAGTNKIKYSFTTERKIGENNIENDFIFTSC